MTTRSDVERRQGYVHVYTGNGKGKTTAAFGLALRAVGAGHRVFIVQFLKPGEGCEHRALSQFANQVVFRQVYTPGPAHRTRTCSRDDTGNPALQEIESAVREGRYDMVILDEANVAVSFGLIRLEWLVGLIESRAASLELIITGRGASEHVIRRAHVVTDMREVKHYFRQGVPARAGVDL